MLILKKCQKFHFGEGIVDGKWIKIRGKWYYWFVVLDQQTALPIFAQLLKTRSRWACRSRAHRTIGGGPKNGQ